MEKKKKKKKKRLAMFKQNNKLPGLNTEVFTGKIFIIQVPL